MSEEILARAEALLVDMMDGSAQGRALARKFFESLKQGQTPEEVLATAERIWSELEEKAPRLPDG